MFFVDINEITFFSVICYCMVIFCTVLVALRLSITGKARYNCYPQSVIFVLFDAASFVLLIGNDVPSLYYVG